MADQKITELGSYTTPLSTDVLPIVSDPGGTPVTKKVLVSDLMKKSAGFWDQYIIKSTNQDVTNNATVQNDTELFFAVSSGETWFVQLFLVYSGSDATGDYKLDWGLPTVSGWWRFLGDNTTADAINLSTGIRQSALTSLAAQLSLGTAADVTVHRVLLAELFFTAGSSANLQFKFGNASASAGRISRTCSGSILRGMKLA